MKKGNGIGGFTIIELMIVIGLVAILVGLAYPGYSQYVRKANRGEAQQLLMNWSVTQEIWRSNNPSYATTTQLPAPTHGSYAFTLVGTPNANSFTLRAVGSGNQVDDEANDGTDCKTLTLNQAGTKSPAVCWD